MRTGVERIPDEVWGYTVLGALLLSMGGGWIFYTLLYPSTPPGNPTLAFFFVPAGGILAGLGVYLVWRAEILYQSTRRAQP